MSKPKTKQIRLTITLKQFNEVARIYAETNLRKQSIYDSAFNLGLEAVKVEHEANKADGFRGVK